MTRVQPWENLYPPPKKKWEMRQKTGEGKEFGFYSDNRKIFTQ